MTTNYAIVGSDHAGIRRQFILDMAHGEPLKLVRDPKNKFDVNAIAVFWGEQRIGWIKATQAAQLARRMDGFKMPVITANLKRKSSDGSTIGFPMCTVADEVFTTTEKTDERQPTSGGQGP